MLSSRHGKILLGLLFLAVIAAFAAGIASRPTDVMAQMAPGPPPMGEDGQPVPPPPGGVIPGTPGGMNQGMQMPRMMPGMMQGMGGGVAIAAAGNYVYVVAGNTVYQLKADTLKIVNSTQLTPPSGGGALPRPGSGPGGFGESRQ